MPVLTDGLLRHSPLRRVGTLLVIAFVATLLVAHIAIAVSVLGERAWIDYHTYVLAYAKVIAGQSPYSAIQLEGPYRLDSVLLEGYAYPPPSVLLFAPFAIPGVGLVLFTVVNVGLFLAGVLRVVHYELGRVSATSVAIVLISLAGYWPLAVGVASGNVNVGLAGLLAIAWSSSFSKHPGFAVAAATATVMKVVPGVLVFWAIRHQGRHAAAVAILTGLSIVLVSAPVVGLNRWAEFGTALSNAVPICEGWLHVSVACVASPLVGISLAKLLGVLIGVVAVAAMLLVRSRLAAFALLVIAWLAPVTDFHDHTWVFLYVVFLVIFVVSIKRLRSQIPS